MNINQRKLDDVTLLDIDGNLVLGEEPRFNQFIEDYIKAGGRKLIINLEKVKYVDSTGLGLLILAYKAMLRAGGDIKLLHVQQHLMKILVMTKVISVFETFDSESAAISSFAPAT